MWHFALLLALPSIMAIDAPPEQPTWLMDYNQAHKAARAEQKPIAVFFGKGAEGKDSWTREASREAKRLLSQGYVCVYFDTTLSAGKQLAEDFELPRGLGFVLSDRTGGLQAFRHSGQMNSDDFTRILVRFADPEHVARTTETLVSERISYYSPSAAAQTSPTMQPFSPGTYSGQPLIYPSNFGYAPRNCST